MGPEFSIVMRDRQVAWAQSGGVPSEALEKRHGGISWVLRRDYQTRNMMYPGWWDYIRGKEHRWARALNSSQCFGVNLFAPLADEPTRAPKAIQTLLPERDVRLDDEIAVHFEHTPPMAPMWLGERGQPTQIDVYFKIARRGTCLGHLVVEVKFTESGFGGCRGWGSGSGRANQNPDRDRCLNVGAVAREPKANCWLVGSEGRRYWEIMAKPSSSMQLGTISKAGACPFRYGLYQMMRNRVLADELKRNTEAEWAEFAICRHPENDSVLKLEEPVGDATDAVKAFRDLSANDAVRDWNAMDVLAAIGSTDDRLTDWESWVRRRYFAY